MEFNYKSRAGARVGSARADGRSRVRAVRYIIFKNLMRTCTERDSPNLPENRCKEYNMRLLIFIKKWLTNVSLRGSVATEAISLK